MQSKPILLFDNIVILYSLFGYELHLQCQSLADQLSVGNGSDTLHGTETGTETGNRMDTIENNCFLNLFLSLCNVCTVHSVIQKPIISQSLSLSLTRSRAVCMSHNNAQMDGSPDVSMNRFTSWNYPVPLPIDSSALRTTIIFLIHTLASSRWTKILHLVSS